MSAKQALKTTPKDQVYEDILPEIAGLISRDDDLIANLSGISVILAQSFGRLGPDKLNVIDTLYLEHVFSLLHKKYLTGGAG